MKSTARKKTYDLDEEMVGKVRRFFKVKTDAEAISKSLSKTIEDIEIQESLEKLLSKGRFRVVYR